MRGKEASCILPDIAAVRKVVDPVPDEQVMGDLDALVAYAKNIRRGGRIESA